MISVGPIWVVTEIDFHESPHINRLAAEGVRFTDFYAAAPICSATRASIFSGQYPARLGTDRFFSRTLAAV